MWNRICAMHSPSAESRRAIARATLLAALAWGGVDGVHAQAVCLWEVLAQPQHSTHC